MNTNKYILLTIDVEDWFQVENFKPWIPFETWDQRELRVERNVHNLLNLFDSIELVAHSSQLTADKQEGTGYELSAMNYELAPKVHNELTAMSYEKSHPKVTFFILGWLAERLPNLVREIQSCGHEVASHGYNHNLCNQQSYDDLKKELTESKKLLEDITGAQVCGFRAPNFSINDDVLKIVEECGYLYDSSYNSFGLHGRYGKISLNGHRKKGIALQFSDNFFELPISNILIKGRTFPLGGGAYFRLLPFPIFKMGVSSILKKDDIYLFYAHPWEVDPNQPKVVSASKLSKIKHYTNIRQTELKLKKLIKDLDQCHYIPCSQYLDQIRHYEL